MNDAQREAMAKAREETRAVRAYLESLTKHRGRGGYRASPEVLVAKIDKLHDQLLDETDPLKRLQQRQKLRDAESMLEAIDEDDSEQIEAAFIKVAASYSERMGIDYLTWRETGVPASILKQAGIARQSS